MVPLLFGFRPSVWQMHYCYLSFVRTFCTFFWRTLPTWHGAFDVLVLDVLTSTGFSWFLLNSCCSGIYHALSFIFGFVTIAYYYPGGDPLKMDQAWLTSRVSIFFFGGWGEREDCAYSCSSAKFLKFKPLSPFAALSVSCSATRCNSCQLLTFHSFRRKTSSNLCISSLNPLQDFSYCLLSSSRTQAY